MRIAAQNITVELAGRSFALRPSLGAAIRLAYEIDDFGALMKCLAEGHTEALALVISETSGNSIAEVRAALAPPFGGKLIPAIEACMSVVAAMLDFGEKAEGNSTGPVVAISEVFEQLFTLGTGWIGWPPSATWEATPQEIIAAHSGRVAMLKAIFGSEEEDKPSGPDFTADPDASNKLRAIALGGGNMAA